MKIAIFLFSIYLVTLSCLPCSDSIIDLSVDNHLDKKELSQQEEHNHSNNIDLCSPFCSCACCGSQMINETCIISLYFFINSNKISSKLSTYKSNLTSNFFGSIWQPPQII